MQLRSPLWLAAFHGHVEVVRFLATQPGIDLESRCEELVQQTEGPGHEDKVARGPYVGTMRGVTPLFAATEQGHAQVTLTSTI